MSQTEPADSRTRAARAGALGGAVGGLLGGALGGAFGSGIRLMAPPEPVASLAGACIGACAFTPAAAVLGGLVGLVLPGRVGRRLFFGVTAFAGFFSSAAGAVEADQEGSAGAAAAFALGMVLLLAAGLALPLLRRPLWALRWPLLAWLVVCLIGAACSRLFPRQFTSLDPAPAETVVQLRCAPLPAPLGTIALHYWFTEFAPEEGRWHRWELWQTADAGGTSWGHVHRDLMPPASGTGGGPGWVTAEWRGEPARRLRAALAESPHYPARDRYFAWPGPNSNTYVAWILRRAAVSADLGPRGIGGNYLGVCGAAVTTTRTGAQVETPVLGLKAGLLDGMEVHLIGFTAGVGFWPPAVKTPLGRVGFAE